MPGNPLNILLLGQTSRPEMRPVVEAVNEVAAELRQLDDVQSAGRMVTDQNWYPDLAVVCQSWPDEFSQAEVERLLSLLPLARWVCCYGAWCESDGRSRSIWPLSVRVPVCCAAARIRRQLAVIQGEQTVLPLTAARNEIIEFDAPVDLSLRESGLPVFVKSPDPELRCWIQDLLAKVGCRIVPCHELRSASNSDSAAPVRQTRRFQNKPRTVAQAEISSAVTLIWDVDPWSDRTANELQDFHQRNPHVTIIALTGFALAEDVVVIEQCGAAAVVPKLSAQSQLLESLDRSA